MGLDDLKKESSEVLLRETCKTLDIILKNEYKREREHDLQEKHNPNKGNSIK